MAQMVSLSVKINPEYLMIANNTYALNEYLLTQNTKNKKYYRRYI